MGHSPNNVLAALNFTAGSGVLAFWLLYFTEGAALGQGHALKDTFEAAFPVADGLLAAALFATGIAALKRSPATTFFLVAASSMGLYLGVLDTTFYLRHGLYTPLRAEALIELAINAVCVGGGLAGLVHGWRRLGAGAAR